MTHGRVLFSVACWTGSARGSQRRQPLSGLNAVYFRLFWARSFANVEPFLVLLPVPVRPAKPFDAPTIQALIESYVPLGTLLPRSLDFVLMNIEHYLVDERDGAVVGCVHLEDYSPSLAEIRSLSVDERYQGHRVGTTLVSAAEILARRRQYTTVFAVSDRDQFFKALGYDERYIPELDRERSQVSRFKGVYAKDV